MSDLPGDMTMAEPLRPTALGWEEQKGRADKAEARIQAITEAVILWRDRPSGDIGLAIALAQILDADAPEPPAAGALARVLQECDRLYNAHVNRDRVPLTALDQGVVKAVERIRQAAAQRSSGEAA